MSSVGCMVLAAGEGERFGEPKQFHELLPGVRLVDAALASAARAADRVVLVAPPGHSWRGSAVAHVVSGGETRRESVLAGLAGMPDGVDIVLVHDAAHPLAPDRIFADLATAIRGGADGAVPFQPVAEVVKRIADDGSLSTVGRDDLGLAQMPMGFRRTALRACLEASAEGLAEYREDSMVLEELGFRVVAVPGAEINMHVVTRSDLELARTLAARLDREGNSA